MRVLNTIVLIVLIHIPSRVICQDVPHPIANTGIYEFLDELSSQHLITISTSVKPYSRLQIAQWLFETDSNRESLSLRQRKELDFYKTDFSKEISELTTPRKRFDLFHYKDSLFSFTVNPILSSEILSNSTGVAWNWRNGIEARSYIGRWGFYAALRDNHEKPFLGRPEFLSQRQGGHIKGSTDWSEMTGGVIWSWDWGSAGLLKENFQWGYNYNGANIFGGRNPSFIHFALNLKPVEWFQVTYLHGWLNSEVVDSNRSYWVTNSYGTDYREVYHKKFLAANLFTFIPTKNLSVSIGNSIIYDGSGANAAYLVPVFFYKSVDHSLSSGIDNMNSQMFIDLSSRQLKHLHIYGTLFIDELSIKRVFNKEEWNFLSYKGGVRVSGFPVSDLTFTTEFTYSYPLVFQHYVPTLTFESNRYNLGHYLKDNSREWHFAFNYKPVRSLDIKIWLTDAIRGNDYTSLGGSRTGNPPLESIIWKSRIVGLALSWQVINDLYLRTVYTIGTNEGVSSWHSSQFDGRQNTISISAGYGF